ncbi:MAG: glutathione synthase [Gammaproteobacteria bacterium]|jgi:glutathione synthase|nr:glutathione synthase [Gammaproteobacteria bacterium]
MSIALGVVMDPIDSIKPAKDSTLAMLIAAQKRGWRLWYMEPHDLTLQGAALRARMTALTVRDDPNDWFEFGEERRAPLKSLQVVLMRKDPPFDINYVYTTFLLEQAEAEGVLVVNRPSALRDTNEKLSLAGFPHLCPPTLVSCDPYELRAFLAEHGDIILKPLQGMGGESVFRLRHDDANLSVVIEVMTDRGRAPAMAQRYLPEITRGDKRILMVDGEPVPYALARIPAAGETRANLAAGGQGIGQPLSERERWICAQVGPELRRRGLMFVGLDVIGDWLTEINVTSPTCIRELDAQFGLDIAGQLMDCIEARLQ